MRKNATCSVLESKDRLKDLILFLFKTAGPTTALFALYLFMITLNVLSLPLADTQLVIRLINYPGLFAQSALFG